MIYPREKRSKQNKCKENELHRKYMFFGGGVLQETYLSYIQQQFHRYNKIYGLFHLPWLGASHTGFANFWKLKIWEANQKFFSTNYIFKLFFCFVCFYLKEIEYSKSGMWQSRQFNFLQNVVCFSLLGQKLWEEIHF